MKEIVWKSNNIGGQNAYVGRILIGKYWYNGIDTNLGTYKVSSYILGSKLINERVFEEDTAKSLITTEWLRFVTEITK